MRLQGEQGGGSGLGIIALALFSLILMATGASVLSGSSNYNLTAMVVSGGGPDSSSANYNASQVIG